MVGKTRRPTADVLKGYNRLTELSSYQLKELARKLEIFTVSRGTHLLTIGSMDESTLFLISGEVELVAEDGHRIRIIGGSRTARSPLGRLRPARYTITAATPQVEYLRIENDVLEDYLPFDEGSSLLIDSSTYVINESLMDSDPDSESPLASRIFEDLSSSRLLLPSLPGVAQHVGRMALEAGDDVRRLAQAVMMDPALAVKVIRSVNIHLGSNDSPTQTCLEAVERLGAQRTSTLIINWVLRETLRTRCSRLRNGLERWWQNSLKVSAISYVLARQCERFDPEFAALAGLIHNVGEPIVLDYAENHPELLEGRAEDEIVAALAPEIGRVVLTMWNLSHELITAASEARNWMRDHQHAPDYADVVLVAQLYAAASDPGTRDLPRVDRTPAFHRLGLQDVSREFNLHIQNAARHALAQTAQLLAA